MSPSNYTTPTNVGPAGPRAHETDRYVLEFAESPALTAMYDAIAELVAHPQRLAALVRRAAAETLLVAIRDEFIRQLPKAVDMERVVGHYGDGVVRGSPRDTGTEEQEQMRELYGLLHNAQRRGDLDSVRAVRERMQDVQDRFRESLQRLRSRRRQKERHYLSSGQFRPRALKVLALLTDPNLVGTTATSEAVTVSIGRTALLDAVKTPSATEFALKRGPTKSKYNVLWRHLEFGTGVHGVKNSDIADTEGKSTYFNKDLQRGLWFYGRRLKEAKLVLHGSQAMLALHEPNTTHALHGQRHIPRGLLRMYEALGTYLHAALRGGLGPENPA